jgi:hypothetical protein
MSARRGGGVTVAGFRIGIWGSGWFLTFEELRRLPEAEQLRLLINQIAQEWGFGGAQSETKRQLSGREPREARQIRIRNAGWRLIRGCKAWCSATASISAGRTWWLDGS